MRESQLGIQSDSSPRATPLLRGLESERDRPAAGCRSPGTQQHSLTDARTDDQGKETKVPQIRPMAVTSSQAALCELLKRLKAPGKGENLGASVKASEGPGGAFFLAPFLPPGGQIEEGP